MGNGSKWREQGEGTMPDYTDPLGPVGEWSEEWSDEEAQACQVSLVLGEIPAMTERRKNETLARVISEVHAEHDDPENPIPEVKEWKNGRLRDAIPARHCQSYQELVSDSLKALDLAPKAPAIPSNPSVGQFTGASVRHNAALNGVEIMFPSKPDSKTLDALRENHFRWSSKSKLWYATFTPAVWALAHKLADLPVYPQ